MNIQLLTKDDLKEFKAELLEEIRQLLSAKAVPSATQGRWLRSYQVRELLHISPGTLQNLRINGTLKATKIGGILFYSMNELEALMKK